MNSLGRVFNAPTRLPPWNLRTEVPKPPSIRCFVLTAARPERKAWTQEEVHELDKMRKEGKSYNDIAAALARTRNSVYAMVYHPRSTEPLRRTALRWREPWTEAEVQTLRDAYARGETMVSIASLTNRSVHSVDGALTTFHIRPPIPALKAQIYREAALQRKPWTQEQHDLATTLRKQGASYKDISHVIGKSVTNVRARLEREIYNGGSAKIGYYLTESEFGQIKRLYIDGKSTKEIHTALPHRSNATIERAVARLKDRKQDDGE